MYSQRLSPSTRPRKGYSTSQDDAATERVASPLARTMSAKQSPGVASSRMSGDFQVLQTDVDQNRGAVMDARLALASSLDRLGEHHVRLREYDDAMDAFTEALHEKRSIMSILFPPRGSAANTMSLYDNEMSDEFSEQRDRAIDDIVHTLRNMGNVHSLRGEQDEAMRYYTEVTNLRAAKSSSRLDSEDTATLLSGLGGTGEEDTSTLMSEINEDMKALDDMFRSISFRHQESSSHPMWNSRKSMPLGSAAENTSPRSKRRKAEGGQGSLSGLESEPFRRSTSMSLSTSRNELAEALTLYRSVLETHRVPNLEQHMENLNSLALRVDLLTGTLKEAGGGGRGNRVEDLELALEIYHQVLAAQEELKAVEEADGLQPTEVSAGVASTLIRMGSLYYKLGNRFEELRMYEEAKTIYCNTFGENHAFVAGARKNIGMVLAEKGEYAAAVEQFDKAKRIYLAVRGGDPMNRDVASAISCMGNVKNRLGELDDALTHYMEALAIYKTIQGKATSNERIALAIRDVTGTLKVIGMVRAKMGDLDAAMGFFTEAMTLLRTSGIDSTPAGREITSSILTRMASIHVKKSDLDQAMDHYREAYELTIQNRGTTNHQEVACILHYIGGIFHKRSDFDEAMNCYQEAIRIYHTTLGPANPTVAGTLVMVGSIHYKRRNLDSAMMFYREALRLNRDAYGLHHPDVAPILKSIGTILTKKGEYQEAYDVFRDVLSIKCTIHGTGHPEVASAYKSLGNVHYKMGELADAERQYRHALTIYRRTRGEEHRDTVAAKTTIEHIRYWMRERGQRKLEERHAQNSRRSRADEDERSC